MLTSVAAAAVAAGTLTLAAPGSAGAVAWIDSGAINGGVFGTATSLDVASTGPGDAIAAWTVPAGDIDRVYVSRAVNGDWGNPAVLSPAGQDASQVRVAANPKGDAVVTWEHPGGGPDLIVVDGRRLSAGTWGPMTNLVPTPSDNTLFHDVAVDDSGHAVVTYRIAHGLDSTAFVSDWPKVGSVTSSPIDSGTDDEFAPALAANADGDVLVSFARSGDIYATRRLGGSTSWSPAVKVVTNSPLADSSVALRPDGSGVVVGTQNGTPDVVRAVEIGANGAAGQSTVLSDTDLSANNGSVTANADGDVLVAWETMGNEGRGIDYAVRPAGGAFSAPAVLQDPVAANPQHPETVLTDQDLRTVISSTPSALRVWHRASGFQAPWQNHDAGPSLPIGQYAVDADAEGNVVVVGTGNNLVHAEFLDASGPVTKVVKPTRAISTTDQLKVGWSVHDSLSQIAPTVDVYATTAPWNAAGHGARRSSSTTRPVTRSRTRPRRARRTASRSAPRTRSATSPPPSRGATRSRSTTASWAARAGPRRWARATSSTP
ncbi:hypothetical protein D0Z08_06755 [Nocardioides immobilis]|uniref:WD40 repeat domain-containing protein n=2 Tax=Nocardioides immobilis TaxID=2049295 RepID=A0A417Y5V5_9ACTN|nr:hypothetical protein D0Z08_06755 [Nocardioides immobilis]